MNKKMTYEAPVTEQMEVRVEKNFLGSEPNVGASSVETLDNINGSWDD